jgi:glycosyltransferase involved in cell wall biosynthesis
MKVMFDHSTPFYLTHGGFQVQIEQTKAGLEAIGVEVEYARWWDSKQKADVLHYFGRPPLGYAPSLIRSGFKLVLAELLTGMSSRSPAQRWSQRAIKLVAEKCLPSVLTMRLSWDCFRQAHACIALTPWEAQLLHEMFQAPRERLHCVPNGVEAAFLESVPAPSRGPWLVCTATITDRKRPLELAQLAVAAERPVWIVGRPYADADPYAQQFLAFVKQHPKLVRYEGGISDRVQLAKVYREARGFVLLSTMESLSLSALEAAACECPLLLSDLPWARCTFGDDASYCPVKNTPDAVAALQSFYDRAPQLRPPPRPKSWVEVARMFEKIYRSILT